MDMPLEWRASRRMFPGLQLHHVARFCSRELVSFSSATVSGTVMDLDLEIPNTGSWYTI